MDGWMMCCFRVIGKMIAENCHLLAWIFATLSLLNAVTASVIRDFLLKEDESVKQNSSNFLHPSPHLSFNYVASDV